MAQAGTLLDFGLATLEEVEGVGGFGVDMFDHGEDVEDVLLSEGRLVPAVHVILLDEDLGGEREACHSAGPRAGEGGKQGQSREGLAGLPGYPS